MPERARRRAAFLLYAAIQFVVLTAIAMRLYAGGTFADASSSGYQLARNFFSDLGATTSWSGRANHASMVLFAIALGTLGIAFAAFAGAWRAFAFTRSRARLAGIAAQGFGALSGAAFLAVAATPVNVAIHLHNTFVVAAFGLLLGYAASMTFVLWRNVTDRALFAASGAYVLIVLAYVAMIVVALRDGVATDRGVTIMVISQKVITYTSMLYIAFLTRSARRLCVATVSVR